VTDEFQFTPAQRPLVGERLGALVQDLADRQYGVVSRAQLVAIGVGESAVSRWTRNGRLQRIHHGVYAVGHRRIRREGWWQAGLLLGGLDARLAHWTSVSCWALVQHSRTTVHIVGAGRRGTTTPGVHAHRTKLHPDDCATCDGFPVTSVARTMIDVADDATADQLGEMLDAALRLRLYDARAMTDAVDRAHGRRGLAKLLPALTAMGDESVRFRSTTERRVRDRLVAAGLPRPLVNQPVDKGDGSHYELDLLWPASRLNVEIDGPQHLLPHQRSKDAARDRWLRARGYAVRRFPVERVDHDFPAIVAEIRGLLGPFAN
jgi:hypothetical protein